MSISVFSALTLMCLDGAMAARPLEPVDQPVEPQVVAVAAMDDEKNEPDPAADTEQVLDAEVDPEVGTDEVISVGEGARKDSGELIAPAVKAGDKILFGKWSGTEITLDGEELLIMKESDVLGIIA